MQELFMQFRGFSVLTLALTCAAIALSSCDSGNPVSGSATITDDQVIGTWVMTHTNFYGQEMIASDTTMQASSTYSSNATFVAITMYYANAASITRDTTHGTWKTSGDKLITLDNGSTVPDTMTVSISGSSMTATMTDVDGTIRLYATKQ